MELIRVDDYIVATGVTPDDLALAVRELIKRGYQPYMSGYSKGDLFCQPMIQGGW